MRFHWQSSLMLATMAALLFGSAAPMTAQDFEESDVYFELNDTDGDLGIHALIDGDAWRTLAVLTPRGRADLMITLAGSMRRQGLTELFIESAEPNFSDLSPPQFFRRFPEGDYVIRAVTLEGDQFESEDMVTHLMPGPPQNVRVNGKLLPEDCDAELPTVSEPLRINWQAVEMSHPTIGHRNEPIEVMKYQLVLENDDESQIFTFDLPPEVTEMDVPAFAAPGEVVKVEVLVKEASGGNQTAVESCFEVE